MAKISIVAAYDEERAIGKNNQLLWHLPEDLRRFKELTLHKTVIMGRKTFESIGKPLPKRKNVVLSHHAISTPDILVYHSYDEALLALGDEPEIMVIGGASVYEKALPHADKLYLTVVHNKFEADVFFPKWDINQWHCVAALEIPQDERNAYAMTFKEYIRK